MREILFRGKSPINNEFVIGDLFQNGDRCFIMVLNRNIEVESKTVGQYTGLTDKNGTKIFEGDIVRDDDGDVMMVKWLTEGAVFVLEPKPYVSVHFYSTLPSRIEVIGNIHDNPELMGGNTHG